jgi:acetyl esterase/lipase
MASPPSRLVRPAAGLSLLVVATLTAGCGPPGPMPVVGETPLTLPGEPVEVLPDVAVHVVEPSGGATPEVVVVLVPGGGWTSADPTGMVPLAERLAGGGALVVLGTYRTAGDEVYFPGPAQDVGCLVAFGADAAAQRGADGAEVVLLGHSAGGQLAAVVALDPDVGRSPDCPFPPAEADRLVGLAGVYDVTAAPDLAVRLFGPDHVDPAGWAAGDPVALAGDRPDLPVLLVHGDADTLVPVSQTYALMQPLLEAGHPVEVSYLEGVDHHTVYTADVAGPVVEQWLGL